MSRKAIAAAAIISLVGLGCGRGQAQKDDIQTVAEWIVVSGAVDSLGEVLQNAIKEVVTPMPTNSNTSAGEVFGAWTSRWREVSRICDSATPYIVELETRVKSQASQSNCELVGKKLETVSSYSNEAVGILDKFMENRDVYLLASRQSDLVNAGTQVYHAWEDIQNLRKQGEPVRAAAKRLLESMNQ